MHPHVPKPGAGDTGPRGVRIADGGYASPITLQYMPVDKIRVGKRHRKDRGDLNAQLSRHELLAAPNIGRAASAAVVLWLARHGLELQAKGAPSQGRLSHFTSPLAADRSHERNGWIRPPES
jgi:hypothetical protein